MKNKKVFVLLLVLVCVVPENSRGEESGSGFWNVLPETVLRPFGFLGTLSGCALFVAATPFTAIASIEAPHDAFQNSLNGFVLAPVRYTFTRPIGDYSFEVYPQ